MEADDKKDILDAITHIDGKNEKRAKDLHSRINEQGESFQTQLTQQTKDFTTTVREMSIDQAALKATVDRNVKDISKLDSEVDTNKTEIAKMRRSSTSRATEDRRDPGPPVRYGSSGVLAVEESLTYKLLTSKAFWGGIAGGILLLVLGILKATGTI